MEQRWSPRTRVNLDVDLLVKGKEIGGCRTRDIGMGGAFVEVSKDLQIEKAIVELIFKLGSSNQISRHKIKAMIVRVAQDGVGLMFRDFDASAFRSLQEILQYAQSHTMH
ncbi:MAG TPA: PilZ domain-containing protein [Gammaproteobacteria bacterium]